MFSLLWNSGIVNPMTNALLLLYDLLGNNFFAALAIFTVVTRLALLPLNLKSQRSTLKMQEMQPQIKKIQTRYKDDPRKMQEKFNEIGYNPSEQLGGCLIMFLQFPIFIGLYRAIQYVLASTPQTMFELSERVYDFVDITPLMPVSNKFAWLNLAQPDPWFVLPILVVGTMFISQKLLMPTPKKKDPNKKGGNEPEDMAQSMQQSMQYTMPLMFGLFSLQFPAGVSIYFVFANLISMLQGFIVKRSMAEERAASEQRRERNAKVADEMVFEDEDGANSSDSGSSNGSKSSAKSRKSNKPSTNGSGKSSDYTRPAKRNTSKRKRNSKR